MRIMLIMSDRASYECIKCGKKFSFPGNLKRHVQEKHGKIKRERYRCKICRKTYITVAELRDHSRRRHKDETDVRRGGEYVCDICFKVFKYRSNIVDHLRYAHDQGSKTRVLFTCQFCKRKFNKKCNLEYHVQHSVCNSNPTPDTRPRIICYKCGTPTLEKNVKLHLNKHCIGIRLAKRNKLKNQKKKEEIDSQNVEIHKQNESHSNMKVKKTITVRELKLKSQKKVSEIREEQEHLTETESYQEEVSTFFRRLRKRKHVDYKSLDDPYAYTMRKSRESSQTEIMSSNLSELQFYNETVPFKLSSEETSFVNIEVLRGDVKAEIAKESDKMIEENTQSSFEVNCLGLNQGEEVIQSIKQEFETDGDFDGDWCVPRQDELVIKADVENHDEKSGIQGITSPFKTK